MIRVVGTGGRYYSDASAVYKALDEIHRITGISAVATGACPYGGADFLVQSWAQKNEVDYRGYCAKFRTEGKKAGPLRNRRMLEDFQPDLVIAFPGGKGTASCVNIAHDLGIPTLDHREK